MESAERTMLSMHIPEQHEGILDRLAARLGDLPGVDEVFYVPDDREIKVLYRPEAEPDREVIMETIRQVVDVA